MPGSTRPPHRGPPDLPHMPPSPEGKEPAKKNGGKALSRFLDWLGKVLVEEAKVEALTDKQAPPFTILHEVTIRQRRTEEVVITAQKVCDDLDEIKRRLSKQFGSSALSFISKSIDPMIDHARGLVADLTSQEKGDGSFPDLLAQAIESVELYSQFSDEKKIKRKIVHDAQNLIHQAIDNDMDWLANYKMDALKPLADEEKKEREVLLDRFLYPIMRELKGMASSHMETDDLHAFFVWQTNVADRRSFLVDLGMATIETLVGEKVVVSDVQEEENEEAIMQEIREVKEEHSDTLSQLSNLEDRTNKFMAFLKNTQSIDSKSMKLIEQLFDDLKSEMDRFAPLRFDSETVTEDFAVLERILQEADGILASRKRLM